MAADPATWFLPFWSNNPDAFNGDGRPWADGTAMAARARIPGAKPWDEGCIVSPFVRGLDAMSSMQRSLETVISVAKASSDPVGERGCVHFAGWRVNALRDLSVQNPWGTNPWTGYESGTQAAPDQTVVGFVVRLLQAGVRVRIIVWMPNSWMKGPANLGPHVTDEFWLAHVVNAETERLTPAPADPLGVVALDLRTADPRRGPRAPMAAAHHQKMMVIRSPEVDAAWVGGVDLAYTRRDAPHLGGDWQSGGDIPPPRSLWPKSPPPVNYGFLASAPIFSDRQGADLPVNVYSDPTRQPSGGDRQIWHDQHLKLQGPIVSTIEAQFAERWREAGRTFDLTQSGHWYGGQVIFSTRRAFNANGIIPLPLGPPVAPIPLETARVQMWRTIPLRQRTRTHGPFLRGEFTVAAGFVQAVKAARELIWISDQYFWSRPYARLVNRRLRAQPSLHVIIVLPPHADAEPEVAHWARRQALQDLVDGLSVAQLLRVGVYNLWLESAPNAPAARNRGIYVHAKSHTYDNDLLMTGSANVNRRSFLCDTELSCAVLSRSVVTAHQQFLWRDLFETPRPNIDLDTPGNGAVFMQAFNAAVATSGAHVIPDPWLNSPPRLPNGVVRRETRGEWRYNTFLDPSSVRLRIEEPVRQGTSTRPADLGDVVHRLEHVWDKNNRRQPYRRS